MPSPDISSAEIRAASGYSRADRLLHRLALGFAPLLDLSFDIERRRFAKAAAQAVAQPPVFVIGLARAGTTLLTRLLHETGAFASLSFRDLPFPLAPNAWSRLSRDGERHVARRERGHGDRLTQDLDSPEAIEEIFWRCHEGSRYRTPEGLKPVPPSAETMAAFHDYVRLVMLRYGRPRYLSKNNNNILRLPELVAAFPDAMLIHPVRDPFQQAASLRAMHRRACALAARDPFRAHYMRWLGHHEFGADQRPFLFAGAPDLTEDRESIDYWLKCWISAYRHLADQPVAIGRRQHVVDHGQLCAMPARVLGALTGRLGLGDGSIDAGMVHRPDERPVEGASRMLLDEAHSLHAELCARAPVLSAAG